MTQTVEAFLLLGAVFVFVAGTILIGCCCQAGTQAAHLGVFAAFGAVSLLIGIVLAATLGRYSPLAGPFITFGMLFGCVFGPAFLLMRSAGS